MTAHLENAAYADWLLGEENPATGEHLGACDVCAKEAGGLHRSVEAFREAILAAGEPHSIVWTAPAQTSAPAGWRMGFRRWAPRMALAACVLAAVLLMRSPAPAPAPVSSDAADNALLESIQDDLNRQAPAALAPAESLVAQMTAGSNSNAQGGNP
jgi:hypothetical protein